MEINKISQIITVSTGTTLAACEAMLLSEGFYSGYKPVEEDASLTYARVLAERIPNYYFLQHGGIEDLCVGGEGVTSSGQEFTLKSAPRSATGPDLRRMLVGSDGIFGHFKNVTVRIFPLPQKTAWGFCLLDHVSEASEFLRNMLTSFIRPLFLCVIDQEETETIMTELGQKTTDKVAVAFKLADLSALLEAKKEALVHMGEELKHRFYWPTRLGTTEKLDELLLKPKFFKQTFRKNAELFLHGADVENLAEKRLKRELENMAQLKRLKIAG
ncbi:hypothetical protein K1X76_06950 [bacterium]|nr:hypothetical protein [bacterium]